MWQWKSHVVFLFDFPLSQVHDPAGSIQCVWHAKGQILTHLYYQLACTGQDKDQVGFIVFDGLLERTGGNAVEVGNWRCQQENGFPSESV